MLDKDHFKKLLKNFGYTMADASKATGIPLGTLMAYMRGTINISSSKLVILADTFDCSCDYLLGRIDEQSYDPAECMTAVEKAVIEKKCAGMEVSEAEMHTDETCTALKSQITHQTPIAVFPYNLIDAINGIPASRGEVYDTSAMAELYSSIKIPLSEDQMRGLNVAIDSLAPREQDIIKKHFMEYLNLEKIGSLLHISRERVRQIEAKALRKLRHPSKFNLIRYGYKGNELRQRENELKAKEEELNTKAERINTECRILEEKIKGVKRRAKKLGFSQKDINDMDSRAFLYCAGMDRPIEYLELSVRSYNVLYRTGIKTINDLVTYIREKGEDWVKIRNCGRKSAAEIDEKLKKYTGCDSNEIIRIAHREQELKKNA